MSCCNGELCDKTRGLPIVLVRRAVAKKEANAPKLSGSFAKMKESIALGEDAHYTLRLLRPGYVYVHNLNDDLQPWRGYIVTPQGYLSPFPISKGGPAIFPYVKNDKDQEPCKPDVNGTIAQCITIPHAEKARDVWIGYSEVEWTQSVWERFNKNEDNCRDKVMTKINISNWLGNPSANNAGLAKTALERVVEFIVGNVDTFQFNFSTTPLAYRMGWSTTDWAAVARELKMQAPKNPSSPSAEEVRNLLFINPKRGGQRRPGSQAAMEKYTTHPIGKLQEAFDRLTKGSPKTQGKAMVLALEDPVGIATDLQALMDARHGEFLTSQSKEFTRKHTVAMAIEGLRNALIEPEIQGKNREIAAFDLGTIVGRFPVNMLEWVNNNRREKAPNFHSMDKEPTAKEIEEWYMSEIKKLEQIQDQAAKDAWKPYENEDRQKEIEGFQEEYQKNLKAYSNKAIAKLDEAHVAWLKSDTFFNHMKYPYDDEKIESGKVYAWTISRCIGSMQDKMACNQLLRDWVMGKVVDERNYYLRALLFNQKDFIKCITDSPVHNYVIDTSAFLGTAKEQEFTDVLNKLNSWGPFLSNVSTFTTEQLKHSAQVDALLSTLFEQGSGVFLARMNRLADIAEKSLEDWQKILGAHIGKPVVIARVRVNAGGLYTFVEDMTHDIVKKVVPKNNFKGGSFKFDKMNAFSVKMPGTAESNLLMVFDVEDARKFAENAKSNIIYGGALQNFGPRGYPDMLVNLTELQRAGSRAAAMTRAAMPHTMNALGFIFGIGAAIKADSDVQEMLSRDEKDQIALGMLKGRRAAEIVAAIGAGASLAGGALEALEATQFRMAQWQGTKKIAGGLKVAGPALGITGGVALASCDAVAGEQARIIGKYGLAAAHFGTAAINLAFAYLAWYTTFSAAAKAAAAAGTSVTTIPIAGANVPIAGIVILLILVYIKLESWKSSKKREEALQTWLDHCSFGKEPGYYLDLKEELRGLELAYQS